MTYEHAIERSAGSLALPNPAASGKRKAATTRVVARPVREWTFRPMLSRHAKPLDEPHFPAELCEALYAAVQVDDKVDAETSLPDVIHLDYDREQFLQCFRICRQVWKEGVDRHDFIAMVRTIRTKRALTADEALAFKHVRAKFKHLRFAYATYDEAHRYPAVFNLVTTVMGQLQDAFKNGQTAAVGRHALLLRALLTPVPFALISGEIDRFRPSSAEGLRRYVFKQVEAIRGALARDEITGKKFHELRKIISRQVSFYDSMRTLYPSAYHTQMSRYLSAINGLMGQMHDELVVKEISGDQDYHADTFPLPEEIRHRLSALVTRYPKA